MVARTARLACWRPLAIGVLATVAALAAGCQHQPASQPLPRSKVTVRNGSGGNAGNAGDFSGVPNHLDPAPQVFNPNPTAGPKPDPDALAGTDRCRERMDQIREGLVLYYAAHGRLPATLDDPELRAAAQDPGDPIIDPVCPASGKPYVYVPAGLRSSARDNKRLILYDPTPAHAGKRRAILMSEPEGNRPLALWVVPLTEQTLGAYTVTPPAAP